MLVVQPHNSPLCLCVAADALLNNLVICLKPMSKVLVKLYAVIMLYYFFSGVYSLRLQYSQGPQYNPGLQYSCGSTVQDSTVSKTAAAGQLPSPVTSTTCAASVMNAPQHQAHKVKQHSLLLPLCCCCCCCCYPQCL